MIFNKILTSLCLSAAFAAALSSCGSSSEQKPYGEPVFGTVTDSTPIASTQYGKVSGENRDGIAVFRGIPYGGNCDGQNRWKAPTPVTPWEGVRDCATANGTIAMQNSGSVPANKYLGPVFNGGHPEYFKCDTEVEGENCLVLDVLTPGIDKAKRGVLVYIHGGGYATGSGTLVLGADKMAREEDIVIVGINHRLNVFGYLYLGALDPEYATSGSAGMQDLVQALQWIRDNIEQFGGDPSKVTIMGESGGASKCCNLLGMPSAQGLFRNAIIESGAGGIGSFSPEIAATQTEALLKKLGIDKKDWRKLFDLDAKTIEDAITGITFAPVADGTVIPACKEGEWAPEISKDINVMVGCSADEIGFTCFIEPMAAEYTWDNLAEKLSTPSGNVLAAAAMPMEKAEEIVKVFKENNPKNDEPWHTFIKIGSLGGVLGSGSFVLAKARSEKGMAPVYNYFVEFDSQSPLSPNYRMAWHTADLPLQFRIVLNPECEKISKTMSHAWASFVRDCTPSTPELEWPAFTAETRQVMVLDDECIVKTDPQKPYREVFALDFN